MKDNIKRFIGSRLQGLVRSSGHLRLAVVLCAGLFAAALAASAAPANDLFASATLITGITGSTNGDSTGATLETCETNMVVTDDSGLVDVSNSIWYAWTAPVTGVVEFDTIGSQFNTVLSIWQTPTGLCDPGLTNLISDDDTGFNEFGDLFNTSYLSFNVLAGQTYYISIDGKNGDFGPSILNWNMLSIPTISSGTFSFATANNTGGSPNFIDSDRESSGTLDAGGSLNPSTPGARITVTRTAGSSGRVSVNYSVSTALLTNLYVTNVFGTNVITMVTDTNVPANTYFTNSSFVITVFTNYLQYYDANLNPAFQYTNYSGAYSNVVTFISNDVAGVVFTITNTTPYVPFGPVPTNLPPVGITLGNPATSTDSSSNNIVAVTNSFSLTPYSTNAIVPAFPNFGNVSGTLTFDDFQLSRYVDVPVSGTAGGPDAQTFSGLPSTLIVTLSNPTLDPLESSDLIPPSLSTQSNAYLNVLSSTFPSAAIPGASVINIERSTLRVNENVNGSNAVIHLIRTGGIDQSVSVQYTTDPNPPNNTFNLLPGSDYAIPGTDFIGVTSTATFPAGISDIAIPVPIQINNNGLVKFNEDINVQLVADSASPVLSFSAGGNPPYRGAVIGEINQATLTVLFNAEPAGSVDRNWNPNGVNYSVPPFLNYPGTSGGSSDSANGNGGTVYAVAEQPDGSAIIAGSFVSFDSQPYNRIARVLSDGFQDPTFLPPPDTGANDFIAALALQPNGNIIAAGNFTAFNGASFPHIVRLTPTGSVDPTFNPGLGANGMIWAVTLQPNGQIIIAGDFTAFNTNVVNGVARLNADGSVDPTFNPGAGPDGTVSAVAVDSAGRVLIGGSFDAVAGTSSGGIARLNPDGSLDPTFNPGIGTYNPGTGGTDPVYAISIQASGQILIGGGFSYLDLDSAGGIARLNTDGTVDTTFSPGFGAYNPVSGFADDVYTIKQQPDGNILIGGNFLYYNQTRRVGLARIFPNGDLDTSFMDTAYNEFAGLINHYHNNNALNTSLYPNGNQRNYVYSIDLEAGGNVLIGGAFLRVGGGSTRDDTRPRSNVARLIGGITPGPGNIELSYPSYSVDKDAGSLYVSLVRTNGSLGIIDASFNVTNAEPGPGIAVPNVNYTLNPAYTLPTWGTMWPNSWMYDAGYFGENYNVGGGPAVYLNIINSTNITGNLSANLQLAKAGGIDIFFLGGENIPLGAALGAQSASPLTIIDDNIRPGILGFSSVTYSVVDNQTNAVITVVRTNGSDDIVTVSYKTLNGTGTNLIDYKGVTNTLTFLGGVVSQTFTIPVINSTTLKPDKTVKLVLFNATGGATLGLTNATLTIVDHNYAPGQLSFSSASYITNENVGSAVITVNRIGGSSGTMDVTAISAPAPGINGAVNGVNFIAGTNALHWDNGDATPKTFTVPLIQDFVVTPNLLVTLRLTNSLVNNIATSAPLTNNSTTNALLTIVNVDSAGKLQFSAPVYSVKKYGGYALIPVVRVGGSAGTVTIDYTTISDGSAQPAVNYYPTNNTLTFTNGQVSEFITVPVIDDGTADGLLYLNLGLSNVTGGAGYGSPTNAVLNIIDTASVNEPPGSIDVTYNSSGFNNSVYALALQSGNKLLVGGDFTQADGVPRQRIARLNSDGSLDTGFLLPNSAYGANGSVRAIAVQSDGRIVLGGFFTNFNSTVANHITRVNPDGTIDSLFNPASGADNPVYALAETFVGGLSKMMVGGAFANLAGSSINGIARLNYDGSLDKAFNPGLGANGIVYCLAIQPADGKVVIGGDFTSVNGNTNFNHIARLNTDGSVDTTFTPGAGASDSVRAIAIQPDGKILIGGLFTQVNGTPSSHIARLNQNGTVDTAFNPGLGASDAVFSIALQSDNRIVLGGEFTQCSGVTRNRITRLNPDGTVDPTINFGTGADNFVAALVVQEDTIQGYPTNVPDEKIILGGGFTHYDGQSEPYLARIYGGSISGSGAFQFSAPTYSVDERGTNIIITVIRTGGTSGTNSAATSDVLVPFATSDGTAVNLINYIGLSTNLDFPVGEVVETVTIPVMDDNVITTNLTVNMTLSPLIPSQVGLQPTAVLTIINDDSAINFTSPTYTVAKNVVNGVAVINFQRLGSVSGTSTVTFTTTSGGTASPGTDYTPVGPTPVTFAPGVSNAIVAIPINNNQIPEGNRTITMQISGAVGSTLYSPSNALLTIIDTVTSPGQLSFSATNYVVTEGGGSGYTNALISVVRSLGSAGVVSAQFLTADGTALAGTKYIATNGVLSFGDGETIKTFSVQIKNTSTAEGPEYLNLVLTNATGGVALAPPTSATLTILNTNIGVAFTSAVNRFSETGGTLYNGNPDTVFVSVTRFNNTNATTTVQYATQDGTAVSNLNYSATSGTLTFPPGASVQLIPVQLLHDTNVTGTLSFTIGLSNPSVGAQLTAPTNTIVQVLDAETGISFLAPSNSVLKTAGTVVLPVFNSNPTLGSVSVSYTTGGGTASPGVDYTATSGTLTFTNGQSLNFIVVPILLNGILQSNQTFNVTLYNAVAPGVLLPPSVETITIIETNTPAGASLNSPVAENADSGTATFDTSNSVAFSGSSIAWFSWTPTNSGDVEFDTYGSVDDILGANLTTELFVFTGTNISSLTEVAGNAGVYPSSQFNIWGYDIFNFNSQLETSSLGLGGLGGFGFGTQPSTLSSESEFTQPYAGPSELHFNAVAGTSYKIAVVASPSGSVKLNWAFHPSGVFRFATEEVDQTGLSYSNGTSLIMYHVSETEGTRGLFSSLGNGTLNQTRSFGTYNVDQMDTTYHGTIFQGTGKFDYEFDMPGLLVSVTRVAGSTGRVQVGYTTMDIPTNSYLVQLALTNGTYLVNGDLAASSVSTTNYSYQTFQFGNTVITFTNPVVSQADYTPVSGVLTFDDSEMSKTIFIPVTDDGGVPRQNRDFMIVLTNAALDATESTDVGQPRVDNIFSTALVRILDADISPRGGSQSSQLVTNVTIDPITLNTVTNTFTNTVYALQPTNSVFNFEKAHYRVTRDISQYWGGTPITVYVNRMGTNTGAETINWRVNNYYLDGVDADLENGEFPLQPGSDYATPTPPNNTGFLGLVPDFDFPQGYSGTLSWPGSPDRNTFSPQPITFTINNNGLQQFNEDFTISLYQTVNKSDLPVGMIGQTTVTILFDDNHPPAGSVDEYYNPDFSYNMLGAVQTTPPEMTHPGTDGEVLGLAVQPDNKTILVGDFFSYDQTARNSIARANPDGSLDYTFNPGSGPNNFVNCIVLNSNYESFIGGAFSSYNGNLCDGIALITTNGVLDGSFNPGLGFNGTVYTLAFQTNGELLVGGDFTSYNGTARRYLALLQANGTLDPSFDPGTNLNSAVYAIAVQPNGQLVVGGNFTEAGGVSGQNYLARLNPDGTFDPTFDPGSGANAAVFALANQPDGNIVVGGEFTIMNGASANRIARITPNGYNDPYFFGGIGVDGPVYSLLVNTNPLFATTNFANTNPIVAVQTNFTIYAGGAFTSINGTHRLGFGRLNADGTVDTSFLDTAYNQFAGLPRDHFNDPLGTVLTCGLQTDGNVMIGGSFARVGGGQSDDVDVRPENVDTNNLLVMENVNVNSSAFGIISQEQKTRTGIRNRSNIARLIGGFTPGPGNIGMANTSYSINKSQSPENVSLVRANGTLGPASANFSVLPGLAQSGVDYQYAGLSPYYTVAWEYNNPSGRMHSDGLFGTNGFVYDEYGRYYSGSQQASSVAVTILDNTNTLNNLTAQFQLANPVPDEFYLGGENTPLGVALGQSIAPFTLIDDHHFSGTFGFTSPNYVGTGQSAAISVLRTNGTYGVVSLKYATTTNGSTALLNNDYLAASGTLTFQPSDTNHTFNVVILSSNYVSAVEKTVNLTLFNLVPPFNGLSSLAQTNAVLRIINPNFQGFLNLSSNLYSANLSAGSVAITVNRSVGSKGTLSVQCASTDGTAVNGTDYLGFTNTLQWNNGDVTPKVINVPLLNHGTVGGGKQFSVSIYNPALNNVSTPSLFPPTGTTNAIVLLNNDNSYGTFQFSAPGYVVNETGGYSVLTVIRNGGTNGTATVNFTNINATAFAGTNYVATNGTLTFLPGQLAATIQVPILNDGVVDPSPSSFYFTTVLSAPSAGATLGTPVSANTYIVDASSFNRPPGSPDTSFNPGSGMNSDVYALALQSDGQIIAGGNFTAVDGVPESYLARLNTDGTLDRSGFLYGLSGANSAVYALAAQTDDNILVGGTFTNINGTILNHIARLNGLDGSLDTSFNPGAGADNTVYSIAETFIGGSRFVYVGGAFGFISGNSSPFVARLKNNGVLDPSFVTGSGPNATVYAVAPYPTNSFFAGKVLIGGAFTNVNNNPVGCIARLNLDGSVDTNFAANVAIGAGNTVRTIAIQNDGRILVGGDFTNFDGVALNHLARLNSDGTLDSTFTSNLGVGANATVSALALQADNRIVVAGQFTQASGVTRNRLTRLLPSGAVDPTINFGDGANGAVNAVVIQPADQMLVIGGSFTSYNDQLADHVARVYGGSITGSGLFQFTSAAYSIDENGLQAIIGVKRVGGTSGPNPGGTGSVSVNFATLAAGSTAVAGVNYSNVNLQLTYPAGEVLQYVTVPVMDDSNITPNLTVNLQLSAPTPPAGLGDQSSAVLTIINDDSGVAFGSAAYTVPKNILTGYGSVHVLRLGSSSGTCSVDVFTSTNGTAVTNLDYYPTNVVLTFNPGQTDIVVQVPVINNLIAEGNRTVGLGMSNLVNVLQSSPSNTTLTIIDTVTAPGQLSFSSPTYSATSGSGVATLDVIRTAGSSGSVSVGYNTVPGTATPGINYTASSGTVTFNDGQTNATFTIPLLPNNLAIGPVTLSVFLSNPTGGATLASPTNATLTIANTNVVIVFAAATNTFSETAGIVPVNVTRYNNNTISSTVQYSTTDGTAFSNLNYSATSGTLTFSPGQSSRTILVNLLHDTNYTGTVSFGMNLFNPGVGVQIGAPNPTIIQVTDAEAGISFTNAALTTSKNAGSIQISVVCANTNVEPVLVNSNSVPLSVGYYTMDGTGHYGTDYTTTSGTLYFTNGNAVDTISVPILDNGFVTGNKTFSVILTNPTTPGVLITPSTTVVTILDNNTGLAFSSPSYTVNKSAGGATITVLRFDNTNITSTVNFIATNGTAVNGVNFTATNGTLVFSNGASSSSFVIPISDTTVPQPDLTVLLELTSPVNASLITPSAATLTIHDDTGSDVIPAGAMLVSNSSASDLTNDILGPNDTVTVEFAFRDAGGSNVVNLIAQLVANAGVGSPSPAQASYGPLVYHGHSVSQPFSFVAHGTNNQAITANFNLYDTSLANPIGSAVFGFTLGTVTTAFSNNAAIIINDNTNASPYPSVIHVSGVGGTIIKTTVTLNNLYHQSPSDVDALVTSPSGTNTLIMAHVGGQTTVTNVVLTFDDAVTNAMTHTASAFTATNKPSAILPVRNFP